MVRKTTRSSVKAAEKAKTESPRRTRNRASTQRERSGSRSGESDDDIPLNIIKKLSPNRGDKGSSENESDTDSKKPLKKRSRSKAIKEETLQQPTTHKSRWDKQHKSPQNISGQQDNDEEVNEDQNSKGKSKNKNNSNIENVVNPETENENVQVTDESPSDAKDINHETQAKNGEENKEIDDNTSNINDVANTTDQQSSKVSSEQSAEAIVTQDNQSETIQEGASGSPSEEKTDKSSSKHKQSDRRGSRESSERSKNSDKEQSDKKERRSRERRSSERSSKESSDQKSDDKNNEESRKIRLKRPPIDKRTSESEDKEGRREENGTKKKITLKRLEHKQPSIEESKKSVENLSPAEKPQSEEWGSSYEHNNDHMDNKEKTEDKPARKKITLKRATVEDKKTSTTPEKKEIVIERSISLQESKDHRRQSTSGSTTPEIKRRRSSTFIRSTSENEDKPPAPKKPTKVVKLNRGLPKEPQEPPPPGEETVKKYKWGKSSASYSDVETLKLDVLKQVCPTIEFLKEDEVNLEVAVKEVRIPHKERRKTFTELEEEEMEKIEAELNAEPEAIEIKDNIIAMNRKISIVDDTASKLKPPPSPPRNPVSAVLFITNLVRPFTVKQLKELLERTGKIKEDGFWTDRIKSKCYVYYVKEEEAEATRNALHGVNWPIGNGKKLIIDYATVEDLENAKNPPIPVKREKSPEKENKKPIIIEDENDDKKATRNVKREWDMDKEDEHRGRRSRTRSRERQRKHSRRSYTPEDFQGKKRKHEEPPPQKAMDDLFLKTKATPSIYWQPLSPEEIAMKQQQRQARLEENKRRLEEISRTAPRGTHRDRGRDRNFRRR